MLHHKIIQLALNRKNPSNLFRLNALSTNVALQNKRMRVPKTIKPLSAISPKEESTKLSFVHHPFQISETPLPETFVKEDVFAVVECSGTQYKVVVDDTIVINNLENIDIGMKIDVGKVLMVGSKRGTILGHPYIKGAKVTGEIEEITKDKKVYIFKMRRRKNSKRLRGYRRPVVIVRIVDITVDNSLDDVTKLM